VVRFARVASCSLSPGRRRRIDVDDDIPDATTIDRIATDFRMV
jgi:hypothetical protein